MQESLSTLLDGNYEADESIMTNSRIKAKFSSLVHTVRFSYQSLRDLKHLTSTLNLRILTLTEAMAKKKKKKKKFDTVRIWKKSLEYKQRLFKPASMFSAVRPRGCKTFFSYSTQLSMKIQTHIQKNFNGSNTFGTVKICLRQE